MRSRTLQIAAMVTAALVVPGFVVLALEVQTMARNDLRYRLDRGIPVRDGFPEQRELTVEFITGVVLILALLWLIDRWRISHRPYLQTVLALVVVATVTVNLLLLDATTDVRSSDDIYPSWWTWATGVQGLLVFLLCALAVATVAADRPGPVRIGTVVLKVDDAERAASFWTAALGYTRRPDPTGENSPLLQPPNSGYGTTLTLDTDDRTHVDLFVATAAAQRSTEERLLALGARRVEWADVDHVVLADPEGNLFCVVVEP